MGNQMEKAMEAAGLDALERLERQLDDGAEHGTIDAIEDALSDDGDSQEEQPGNVDMVTELKNVIDAQAKQIEQQEEKIDRMLDVMGKMVTRFGASIGDGQGENVNTSLADDEGPDIPNLSDIQLGR